MNVYLNKFVVTRNTRASAALGELALVTPLPAPELITSVGRFCLLFPYVESCCRRVC